MIHAKTLFDNLGKILGGRFDLFEMQIKMHKPYYTPVLVQNLNIDNKSLKYKFFIGNIPMHEFIECQGPSVNEIWEQILDVLFRFSRHGCIMFDKEGWKCSTMTEFASIDDNHFLAALPADRRILLEKGICSKEHLQIWLDLHENML